jgi:cysteine-rich repeat protein
LNTCKTASCGDGFLQIGVETCDLGAAYSDTGACPTTCQAARCGDGFRRTDITDPTDHAYEACDDGNTDNTDGCLNTCKLP